MKLPYALKKVVFICYIYMLVLAVTEQCHIHVNYRDPTSRHLWNIRILAHL